MRLKKSPDSHHHGDLRQAAIALASKAAQNGAIESMSLRGISRDLGVSSGAIYKHFKDKDALLGAVAQTGFDGLAQMFEECVPFQSDAADRTHALQRFKDLAGAYVSFSQTNYGLWRLMFGPHGLVPSGTPADRPSTYDWLAKSLNELAELGVIEGYSVERQFFAWSSLHGMADLHASPAIQLQTTERAVANQCEMILSAFGYVADNPEPQKLG